MNKFLPILQNRMNRQEMNDQCWPGCGPIGTQDAGGNINWYNFENTI